MNVVFNWTDFAITGVTTQQVQTIMQLSSIFENSTTTLQWTYCENIGDNRGYTASPFGYCSATGDMRLMFQYYNQINPNTSIYNKYYQYMSDSFSGFNANNWIGFPTSWANECKNPLFIKAQLYICNKLYVTPAMQKADSLGLKSAIARGQLYDTQLNFGSLNMIKKITAKPPSTGGDEKTFMSEFLSVRLGILSDDAIWNSSTDRIRVYQTLLSANNMNLSLPFNVTCYGDKFTLKADTIPDPIPTPTPNQAIKSVNLSCVINPQQNTVTNLVLTKNPTDTTTKFLHIKFRLNLQTNQTSNVSITKN